MHTASTPVPSLLEERGHVVDVRDDLVLVRAASRANCARCEAGEGCGGGIIGRLLGERLEVVAARIDGARRPAVGDQVLLSVSARVLVEAAAIAYLLPLLVLLLALALAAQWLAQAAPWQQTSYAAIALAAGLGLTRLVARRRRSYAWRPRARADSTGERPVAQSGTPRCG